MDDKKCACGGTVKFKNYVDKTYSLSCNGCGISATGLLSEEAVLKQYELFQKMKNKGDKEECQI